MLLLTLRSPFRRNQTGLMGAALVAGVLLVGCRDGGAIRNDDDTPPTAIPPASEAQAETQPGNGTIDRPADQRWTVQARLHQGSVYRRLDDGRHGFEALVRVRDARGHLVRGLPPSAFNFTIDRVFGPADLLGTDRFQIAPAFHREKLDIFLLVDGAASVRLWGSDAESELSDWLHAFCETLPADSWRLRVIMVSGDDLRGLPTDPVHAPEDAVMRLNGLCEIDYRPARAFHRALDELADLRSEHARIWPVAVLIGLGQRFRDDHGLPAAIQSAEDRQWVVGTLKVGYADADYTPPHAVPALDVYPAAEAGHRAARALAARAAPYYRLQVHLENARMEPDNLRRMFYIQVSDEAYGGELGLPFTVSTGLPRWASVLLFAGILILLMLLGALLYLVLWAWRDGRKGGDTMSRQSDVPRARAKRRPEQRVFVNASPLSR